MMVIFAASITWFCIKV